jgi:hypothetical protein
MGVFRNMTYGVNHLNKESVYCGEVESLTVNKVCSKYIIKRSYKKGKEDTKFGSKNEKYLFLEKSTVHINPLTPNDL